VIYLERRPVAPLDGCIRVLWYVRAEDLPRRRERILPSGCTQVLLNLERDYLWECPDVGEAYHMPPALVVGARSRYEIIDSSDMNDLIGIAFYPGGFAPFASDRADGFSHQNTALEDVWGTGAQSLRDQLRDMRTPQAKLDALERFLVERFLGKLERKRVVEFALRRFCQNPVVASVKQVAHETGWSERRFSQIFREEVGLAPKVWCRIQRFQRVVQQLHGGMDVRLAEVALDCGYYDQSHLANEFRAFSGMDATSYSRRRGRWAGQIPE
jgi:AraC-like DNA-binding protein